MSLDIFNSDKYIKQKWISEYKNLSQNFKNEELGLLKLFLIKNYHMNKVYKKYTYKELIKTVTYFKQIHQNLKDNLTSKDINKENIRNLINKIKNDNNKEYEALNEEENKLENYLKNFDKNIMMLYFNDIDEWQKDNKNIILNNSELEKENVSTSINEKNEQKTIMTNIDNLENLSLSMLNLNDSNANSIKVIKEKNKFIKLTNTYFPIKNKKYFDKMDNNPIKEYINSIKNEINNITEYKYSSKSMNSFIFGNKNNNTKDENINNIKLYINKIQDNKKLISELKNEIQNINYIIKKELDGEYLGWNESEHKEFIKLKNEFKDKINSFLFLSNLNNVFPYMSISKIKKHIKYYEIYSQLIYLKKLLNEKYNSINKQSKHIDTTLSLNKSFNSNKINQLWNQRNQYKLVDKNNINLKNTLYIRKPKEDYLKTSFKYRTKINFFSRDKQRKNTLDNHTIKITKRRTFNNFYIGKKK